MLKKIAIILLAIIPALAATAQTEEIGVPYIKSCTETEVTVPSGNVTLGGTLTLPTVATGPVPCVLLISGSGAQDRDETIYGYKPFAILARALANAGYASLRLDDRGVGKSQGGDDSSFETRIDDAAAAVDMLRANKMIDSLRIVLAGHSEGAAIAFQLAAEAPEKVAAVISLAGPAVSGLDLMVRQNEMLLDSYGVMLTPQIHDSLADLFTTVASGNKEKIAEAVRKYGPQLGMAPAYYDAQIQALSSPEYVAMIRRDFGAPLPAVKAPVLALCGEWDVQVDPDVNLMAVKRAIPDAQIVKLDCVNHLFQRTATRGESLQYAASASRTFDPQTIGIITSFLDKTLR